jgi:hypothetical protein
MANASKKHMGPASQGKGSGNGAMTELPEGILEENMVLSNRDKSLHSDERSLDSKTVQTEQYHDHVANQRKFEDEHPTVTVGNTSRMSPTMTTESAENSSLSTQRNQSRD